MAYIIEQKIKGNTYLYLVKSYWDKEKKQARQKRIYLGPKEKKTHLTTRKIEKDKIISKYYGNIVLLQTIANRLGLRDCLRKNFPGEYENILALSFYELTEGRPLYLFEYWQEEMYLPNVKKLDSERSSAICEYLGKEEYQRYEFLRQWITMNKPVEGVYYDVTSISSYSRNIDYIEWGYNRDKELLPQLNMGILCNQKDGLPLYYTIYPGSIVDVSTLSNQILMLKSFGLKNVLLILDKGFYSERNITQLYENDMDFIQPLPLSLKKVRKLIEDNSEKIKSAENAFSYKDEILYNLPIEILIGKNKFEGIMYFNENIYLEQKNVFLTKILEIENSIKDKKFNNSQEAENYIEISVPIKFQKYFKYNESTKIIEKNIEEITHYYKYLGYYIIIKNSKKDIDNNKLLDCYRNRDKVEKLFDLTKNHLDGNRLKAHSNATNEGRIFIKFISLIIGSYIHYKMKEKNLFKSFTMKELFAELKKIKYTKLFDATPIISVLTKKQKKIFDAFDIDFNQLHSY